MECPHCHKWIKDGSTTHQQCGWGFGEQREHIACGYDGCKEPAVIRMKIHGWTNVCIQHYLAHAQVKAKDFCMLRGLHTLEDQIAFCSPRLAAIFKRRNNLVEF